MSIDRTTAPAPKELEKVILQEPEIHELDNGIKLYAINGSTQDLLKLEVIFYAGKWQEPEKLIAYATAKLLKEGTKKRTGAAIAEQIEYFGATLTTDCDTDTSDITLYCLTKHFEKLLPIVKEIIAEPVFPENELQIFTQNHKQKLLVNQRKNDYVAQKSFSKVLFGKKHPYGYYSSDKDYDALTTEELQDFHKEKYIPQNCVMIFSGKITGDAIKLVNKYLGEKFSDTNRIEIINSLPLSPAAKNKHFIPKTDSLQSAIRIGKILFNKTHSDYTAMFVLNMAFGGYFGSRLMRNIREDKGYTYGIHSMMVSHVHEGYFYIGTEVGGDVAEKAVDEIYKEMDLLRNEPIPEEELSLVRNYLMGRFMSGIDGPFRTAGAIKGLILYGLGTDFFDNMLLQIKNTTPEQLQSLAKEYLDPSSMIEVIVGKELKESAAVKN